MKDIDFNHISGVFDTLEGTSSRNDMVEILSSLFKELSTEESQILSYLILGRVAPTFVPSEFNYSEKSLLTLLSSLGSDIDVLRKRSETGDIGDTVEYVAAERGFVSKGVSLTELYKILWDIVNTSGTGSVEFKNKIIRDTLERLSPREAKYFTRVICGNLRFGINSKTLLDVFSFVVTGDKSLRDALDRVYGIRADIGYVCSLVVGKDLESVQKLFKSVNIQPGIPVLSRLVNRVSSFDEVFERLGDTVLVQNKYDGLRCQIHKYGKQEGGSHTSVWEKYVKNKGDLGLFINDQVSNVRLFTRNLEDVTEMFPEIVESAKSLPFDSFIMDSEVMGWDSKKKDFLTFQETMQRRRKHGVAAKGVDIPVKAMVFDILYLNGEDLSLNDTSERLQKLPVNDTEGGIQFEDTKKCSSLEQLATLFEDAVSNGYEGLIVKKLEGGYLPGVRNYDWIKLKKSMDKNLVDTVDLVAVGYFAGSGRRSDLGVGAVLGAIYNPEKDVYEVVCKVGTGFTDSQFKTVLDDLSNSISEGQPKNVLLHDENLSPDVWVLPNTVFTVEADEVVLRKDGTMPSLRFPRLVEWGRDKDANDATTLSELKDIYKG